MWDRGIGHLFHDIRIMKDIITDIVIPGSAVLGAIIGGGITIYIYYCNSRLQRAQWLYSLFEKFFYQSGYAEIRCLLDYSNEEELDLLRSIVESHSEQQIEEDFVNYLNFFEFIASLWLLRQLPIKEIRMMFDYYIRQLGNHDFIMDYLTEGGFEGLSALVAKVRKIHERDKMSGELLFVYGTLLRGTNYDMHSLFAKYASFVADGTYQGRLYKITYYPGVVPSNDPSERVKGKVYSLHKPDIALSKLDDYEECGPKFSNPTEYIRRRQKIVFSDGTKRKAWVYIYNHPTDNLTRILSGDFFAYEAEQNASADVNKPHQ